MGNDWKTYNNIETVGKKGRMFFIEASPTTFEGLKYNAKLHKLENTELFNLAISDLDEGKIKISNESENHLGRSILDETQSLDSYEEVNQTSIDAFILQNNIEYICELIKKYFK